MKKRDAWGCMRGRSGWYDMQTRVYKVLILIVLYLIRPAMAHAEKGGNVAILPFRIHTLTPMDHLKKGLQEMLTTRLTSKGIAVIDPGAVNKHPLAFQPSLESGDITTMGKELGAHWVIMGSLTQIGKKISLDLKIFDVSGMKPPLSFFIVEDNIDNLALAADRASMSVYNEVTGAVMIDSIHVKGNKRIESEAILAAMGSKKGDPLDYDQLDKDLRAVYKMGFFKDVHIETEDGPGGKIVILDVSEKPSIGKISFKGNKQVKNEDLQKETGVKLYSILNRHEIAQSINRLKEFYRLKGYYTVEIKDKIEELPQNEVALIYEIEEGEKVYIRKIQFVGNTQFDDDQLKDIMETSEKGFLSWITKSGLLDKKKLEFDVQKITSFYQNRGYIRAKAGDPKITYEKGKGLIITIEIDEGQRYRVKNVKVEGDLIKPEAELLDMVRIKKEKFYNREIVRNDILSLREVYSDDGYAYAEISPLIQEDDKNHVVDISYKVSKGKKVRFERINITGNTVTRDKVIRRELKVVEGGYFSTKDLKRSTQNLHRLGFFEDVEVQTRKGSQDDLMVLDINVKERPTGSFSVGIGYSSFEQAIGMFQVAQNNLFGYGQKLMATGRLGTRTTEFDVSLQEPWLFDRPISAGIQLYKITIDYDEYNKDSLGGALNFGFLLGLDEFTRGTVEYTYDDADITDIAENAALVIRDMEGRNLTSSITLGIVRDSKDRPWNTTSGSVNQISFEYAGGPVGGDVAFNKYLARTAWYFPLFWDTVFVAQGRWGLAEQRPEGKLPIYQKFRIGGINTVRGFEYASISPIDPKTGDRIGGEKMMIYNLEYRFPFLKEQGITGLVFFDAGNVFAKDEDVTFSGIRMSAGTGVRWYSPVGPLRLEYGRNLDQKPGESSGEWEFSVGGLF